MTGQDFGVTDQDPRGSFQISCEVGLQGPGVHALQEGGGHRGFDVQHVLDAFAKLLPAKNKTQRGQRIKMSHNNPLNFRHFYSAVAIWHKYVVIEDIWMLEPFFVLLPNWFLSN